MFKKVFAILTSVLLTATFGTSAFAADSSPDYEKVLAMIEKSNHDIEAKIAKAVIDADELEAKYINDIQKIEESDTVVKLKDQKEKLQQDLEKANDLNKIDKINNELAELDSKLEKETARIDEKMAFVNEEIRNLQLFTPENEKDQKKMKEKLTKLNEQLTKQLDKYNDRTEKFTNDLNKLITNLYTETLKISTDTINKATEKGIHAEASWTLVELGGKWVWIDPIRVGH